MGLPSYFLWNCWFQLTLAISIQEHSFCSPALTLTRCLRRSRPITDIRWMVWSVMTRLQYTGSVIMTVTSPLDLAYMHTASRHQAMCTQRVPNDAVCIFSYEYLFETAKSNWAVKRKWWEMGLSHHTPTARVRDGLISPYANSQSARKWNMFV